jgi:ferredoxin
MGEDGKAYLAREDFCDGLGVCLGECPVDAITFVDVAEPAARPAAVAAPVIPHQCPSLREFAFNKPVAATAAKKAGVASAPSRLNGWPIQLHLVPPNSPRFQGADLLIAASCTAFSFGGFHEELLAGRELVIACPKLDRTEGYAEKLAAILATAKPNSVTIARMQVPCCAGLTNLLVEARDQAGSEVTLREVVLSLQGEVLQENEL